MLKRSAIPCIGFFIPILALGLSACSETGGPILPGDTPVLEPNVIHTREVDYIFLYKVEGNDYYFSRSSVVFKAPYVIKLGDIIYGGPGGATKAGYLRRVTAREYVDGLFFVDDLKLTTEPVMFTEAVQSWDLKESFQPDLADTTAIEFVADGIGITDTGLDLNGLSLEGEAGVTVYVESGHILLADLQVESRHMVMASSVVEVRSATHLTAGFQGDFSFSAAGPVDAGISPVELFRHVEYFPGPAGLPAGYAVTTTVALGVQAISYPGGTAELTGLECRSDMNAESLGTRSNWSLGGECKPSAEVSGLTWPSLPDFTFAPYLVVSVANHLFGVAGVTTTFTQTMTCQITREGGDACFDYSLSGLVSAEFQDGGLWAATGTRPAGSRSGSPLEIIHRCNPVFPDQP